MLDLGKWAKVSPTPKSKWKIGNHLGIFVPLWFGAVIYVLDILVNMVSMPRSSGTVDGLVLKIQDFEILLFILYRPPEAPGQHFPDYLNRIYEDIAF